MESKYEPSEFKEKQKLQNLRTEASAIRALRDNYNLEVKRCLEDRREKQFKILQLREEAKKYKNKRNELNAKVKEMKNQIENLRKIIIEKSKNCNELKAKILELKKLVPTSGNVAQEKFESLEWTIQTTPLNPKQEKTLVNQVKVLEEQLLLHKRLEKEKNKLIDHSNEINAIKSKINTLHDDISKTAEESRKNHEKMMEIFTQIDRMREEMNQIHRKFSEARSNADSAHKKFIELFEEQKNIEKQIDEIIRAREIVKKKKTSESQEELVKIAEEKFKMGSKLNLEEFKLLIGKNKIKLDK